MDLPTFELAYHFFWTFCMLSFGVVGGLLIESSGRERFLATKDLERSAVTDALTGLYNRTRLDQLLQSELERSRRYERPFGLMILDVDHFKELNDAHGHQAGDSALVELAQLLKANSRVTDSLFRWGGEEFVVLSPETDAAGVQVQAEKLRKTIEAHSFSGGHPMQISVGATNNDADDTPERILQRADRALYKAKSDGRNRVEYKTPEAE